MPQKIIYNIIDKDNRIIQLGSLNALIDYLVTSNLISDSERETIRGRYYGCKEEFMKKYNVQIFDTENPKLMESYLKFIIIDKKSNVTINNNNKDNTNKNRVSSSNLSSLEFTNVDKLQFMRDLITYEKIELNVTDIIGMTTLEQAYIITRDSISNKNKIDSIANIIDKYNSANKNRQSPADAISVYDVIIKNTNRIMYKGFGFPDIITLVKQYTQGNTGDFTEQEIKRIYDVMKSYAKDENMLDKITDKLIDDIKTNSKYKYIIRKTGGSLDITPVVLMLKEQNCKLPDTELKYLYKLVDKFNKSEQNVKMSLNYSINKLIRLFNGKNNQNLLGIKYLCNTLNNDRIYLVKDLSKTGDDAYDAIELSKITF